MSGRHGLVIYLDLADTPMGGARLRPPCHDGAPGDAASEQECLRLFGFTCFSAEEDDAESEPEI